MCFFFRHPEGNLENALFFCVFFPEKGGKTIVDGCEEVAINAIWEIIYEILELYTYSEFSHEVWMNPEIV